MADVLPLPPPPLHLNSFLYSKDKVGKFIHCVKVKIKMLKLMIKLHSIT